MDSAADPTTPTPNTALLAYKRTRGPSRFAISEFVPAPTLLHYLNPCRRESPVIRIHPLPQGQALAGLLLDRASSATGKGSSRASGSNVRCSRIRSSQGDYLFAYS